MKLTQEQKEKLTVGGIAFALSVVMLTFGLSLLVFMHNTFDPLFSLVTMIGIVEYVFTGLSALFCIVLGVFALAFFKYVAVDLE